MAPVCPEDFSRVIRVPLADRQFTPLPPGCDHVTICSPLAPNDLDRVAAFLRDYPEVTLGFSGTLTATNLELLSHFPFVKKVAVHLLMADSFDGLRHLSAEVTDLSLAGTCKPVSLAPLSRFTSLRSLHLEGPLRGKVRDPEVLGTLPALRSLSLRSVTLPDLSVLAPLQGLEEFALALGGTADLRALAGLPRLARLDAMRVRGLADMGFLGDLTTLESLKLQDQPRVTRLPSLRRLVRLRELWLGMVAVTDLAPVAAAPGLETFLYGTRAKVPPEIVEPLVGHPALRRASVWFPSKVRTAQAEAQLGLPPVYPQPA